MFSYSLLLMDVDQVFQYVRYCVFVVGYCGGDLFSCCCCELLFQVSGGMLRVVNVLLYKVLMFVFGEGKFVVEFEYIVVVSVDIEVVKIVSYQWW